MIEIQFNFNKKLNISKISTVFLKKLNYFRLWLFFCVFFFLKKKFNLKFFFFEINLNFLILI